MKLCTFEVGSESRVGLALDSDGRWFISDVCSVDSDLPRTMKAFLAGGQPILEAARTAAESAPRLALEGVRLLAPVPDPGNFLAVGLNYKDHIKEVGMKAPERPEVFTKASGTVNRPHGEIHKPAVSDTLDYEGELGVVIGRRCRHVSASRAADVIAGYVVVNDLTIREWVTQYPLPILGKSFDTTGPFGPWIVTGDEVGDPQNLQIRTWVNNQLRQDSNTGEMTFSCYDIIETLTTAMTLEPGDLITTGTPPGVGRGMTPPVYLQTGDTVRVEIENVGTIENKIIDEPTG